MKPFNLELAKAGHSVCTRDGHDVRILCFDKKNSKYPIVALVNKEKEEVIVNCGFNGEVRKSIFHPHDLFMKPTKKEGWINIYKYESEDRCTYRGCAIYASKQNAIDEIMPSHSYIDTIKIEWEE